MIDVVHQVVPYLAARDAVSAHVLQAQRLLASYGLGGEIVAIGADPSLGVSVKPPGAVDERGAIFLYHLAIGSPLADWLASRRTPFAVDYHNITPAHFFGPWDPLFATHLSAGRRQLRDLGPRAMAGFADSSFNAAELRRMGYPSPRVLPFLLDLDGLDGPGDAATSARLSDRRDRLGGADLVFVGRLAPNKGHLDAVAALAAYRRLVDPRARLRLIGKSAVPGYTEAIRALARQLDVGDGVELLTDVSHDELLSHLRGSDVFLCLSDHEGFCVPVVEAMHLGVPVIAFAAGAVPETLGGAGLCLPTKRPLDVAAAIDFVLSDHAARASMVERGCERAVELSAERTGPMFAAAIAELLTITPR